MLIRDSYTQKLGLFLTPPSVGRLSLLFGGRVMSRSKRQAGDEHVLDQRWGGHQVLQLQVEYPLEPLHAQRTQFRELGQQPREVV